MKKILLTILLLFSASTPLWAMQFQSGESLYYDRGELADEDFYIAGEQVSFLGNALQDLFVASSSKAAIAGTVVQDLTVAMVDGEITSKVGDDLRVLANHVDFSGTVGGSALIVGSEVFAKTTCVFENDAWLLGGTVHFNGTANDRLHISAGKVVVEGTVAGDLRIEAESITIGRKARIMGRLDYTSGKELVVETGAYIQMRPAWKKAADADKHKGGLGSVFTFGKVVYRLTVYIGLLALGCIAILLLPQPVRRYAAVMRYEFWPSLGWGFLTAIGVVLSLVILIITIIGIPFAIVLGVMSFVALLATAIGMGYLIGMLLLKPAPDKTSAAIGAFALGFTILSIVELIPVLGDLIGIVVLLVGLGALWLTKNFVEPVVPAAKALPKPAETPKVPAVAAPPEPAVVKPQPVAKKKNDWKPAVPAFKKSPSTAKPVAASKKSVVKKVTKTAAKAVVKKKAAKPSVGRSKKTLAKKTVQKAAKKAVQKK